MGVAAAAALYARGVTRSAIVTGAARTLMTPVFLAGGVAGAAVVAAVLL